MPVMDELGRWLAFIVFVPFTGWLLWIIATALRDYDSAGVPRRKKSKP